MSFSGRVAVRLQKLKALEERATRLVAGNERVPNGAAVWVTDALDLGTTVADRSEACGAAGRRRRT
jgi:hypothetical protein